MKFITINTIQETLVKNPNWDGVDRPNHERDQMERITVDDGSVYLNSDFIISISETHFLFPRLCNSEFPVTRIDYLRGAEVVTIFTEEDPDDLMEKLNLEPRRSPYLIALYDGEQEVIINPSTIKQLIPWANKETTVIYGDGEDQRKVRLKRWGRELMTEINGGDY